MDLKTESTCNELLDEYNATQSKPKSYKLLRKYAENARVSSLAHKHAECHYRKLNRVLLIALMLLTTTSSIIVSIEVIDVNHIVSKLITYLATIISGVISIVKPAERFTQHNAIASEYNDVYTDIEQLLMTTMSRAEILDANHLYLGKLQIFDSQAPPIADSFVNRALKELATATPIASSVRLKKKDHR